MAGSQDFAADPRNAHVRIWLNGRLVLLSAHLDRLFSGAAAIGLDLGLTREGVTAALDAVIAENGMTDGVHLRLMATRGEKTGANQDPRTALGRPTIVIVAEWKVPSPALVTGGLSLATVSRRCTPAHMFDMRLNSHSRLNLILALQEAIRAGADEALMLDPDGFVSSCNATNFFWVRDGEVRTSTGAHCFHGVTRASVIALCRDHAIPLRLLDAPPEDARTADEAFVTGTFGGLTPVREIDGRPLPAALPGPVTHRLRALYQALLDAEARR